MTYARANPLSPEIEEALLSLTEGASLLLSDLSEEGLSQLRYQLYGWFAERGLKPLFRIRREGFLRLRVHRLQISHPKIEELVPALSPIEEYVRDNLLMVEDENTVLEILQAGSGEGGTVAIDQIPLILEEWRRMMVPKQGLDEG